MENIKVVKEAGSNGLYRVTRDGQKLGIVILCHAGWQARHAGVNRMHATKALAVADLAAR